mgnify:CR=1 FL=1
MSTSSTSASTTINTAIRLIEREGGLIPFIRNAGIGGISYAIIAQIITGIINARSLLLGPPRAIGRGFVMLIDLTFGGLGDVFGAGTETTVRSFADGTASLLGPLAQPASVGVVILSIAIFYYGLNRVSISPLSVVQNLRG